MRVCPILLIVLRVRVCGVRAFGWLLVLPILPCFCLDRFHSVPPRDHITLLGLESHRIVTMIFNLDLVCLLAVTLSALASSA